MIRHGQSTANAQGIWQGQLDYPLSHLGRSQARYAGDALLNEEIDSFYASPLSRAFETAEIVARASGFTGDIVAVPGLTERGGGLFEGNTWAGRERDMPEVVSRFREAGEEAGWSLIGAETDEEILARFTPAVDGIMSRPETGMRAVIVTHGGVMRAYLRDAFGPGVLSGGQRAGNASITRIVWGDDGAEELISVADSAHIPAGVSPTGVSPTGSASEPPSE